MSKVAKEDKKDLWPFSQGTKKTRYTHKNAMLILLCKYSTVSLLFYYTTDYRHWLPYQVIILLKNKAEV